MNEPRITKINISGDIYHLARDEKAWREEVEKRWFGTAQYGGYHHHHIMGRYGILKLLIENGIPLGPSIHIHEKSTKKEDREAFDAYIHSAVDRRFPDLWEKLMWIQHIEKNFPKTLKYEVVK